MKNDKKIFTSEEIKNRQNNDTLPLQNEDILSMENISMPPPPPLPTYDSLPVDITDAHVVLLVGGGELAQKVASLAKCVGFEIDILDIQDSFARKDYFPQARYVFKEKYSVVGTEYAIGSSHYIAILTSSLEEILTTLNHVFTSPARYIGVLGDEDTKEQLFEQLRKKGIPQTELACVCCPIGVTIGAVELEEQSIAIVAELIAARAGKLSLPHTRR